MTADLSLVALLQPVLADIGLNLLQLLLFFVSLWLIFLILIQRGKGGGLTAAFGGGGGDSAFGAKAGDAFTKITIVSALVWITLCMVTIARYNPPEAAENPFDKKNEVEESQSDTPSLGSPSVSSPEESSEPETTEDSTPESSSSDDSASSESDDDVAPSESGQ